MLRNADLVVCVDTTGLKNVVVKFRLNNHLDELHTVHSQDNHLAEVQMEMMMEMMEMIHAFSYDGLVSQQKVGYSHQQIQKPEPAWLEKQGMKTRYGAVLVPVCLIYLIPKAKETSRLSKKS